MNREDEKQIDEILESGSIGYAYLLNTETGKLLEKAVSLQPENLSALLKKYGAEMGKISVTDVAGRIVLRAENGEISFCRDRQLHREVEQHLTEFLSAGEKSPKVLEVDRKAADRYFGEKDRAVTQAEYGMRL